MKTEIKADRIETALLPDSMIVESMKIDGKENTMNGFYDMDADAAVNTAVDTVTVPSENAGVGETENPTTEETGTPILWEVTCYGNGGFPAAASYSFDADSFAGDGLSVPVYEGKIFTGWYEDEACTIPFEPVYQKHERPLPYRNHRKEATAIRRIPSPVRSLSNNRDRITYMFLSSIRHTRTWYVFLLLLCQTVSYTLHPHTIR